MYQGQNSGRVGSARGFPELRIYDSMRPWPDHHQILTLGLRKRAVAARGFAKKYRHEFQVTQKRWVGCIGEIAVADVPAYSGVYFLATPLRQDRDQSTLYVGETNSLKDFLANRIRDACQSAPFKREGGRAIELGFIRRSCPDANRLFALQSILLSKDKSQWNDPKLAARAA